VPAAAGDLDAEGYLQPGRAQPDQDRAQAFIIGMPQTQPVSWQEDCHDPLHRQQRSQPQQPPADRQVAPDWLQAALPETGITPGQYSQGD